MPTPDRLLVSIFVLLAGGAARATEPVALAFSKEGTCDNTLTIMSGASQVVTEVCYDTTYAEHGAQRLFQACDTVTMQPRATAKTDRCGMPKLKLLSLARVRFADKTVWHRSAPVDRPKPGEAPLVVKSSSLTYREVGCDDCVTEHVFTFQNAGNKAVKAIGFTAIDGKAEHTSSQSLGDALEPGMLVYEHAQGTTLKLLEVTYADGTKWKAP